MCSASILAFFGTPSGGEMLLVLGVLLLLFGSKKLPGMARTLGRTLEEFRRAAREVSNEIMQGDDEEPRPKVLKEAVPRVAATKPVQSVPVEEVGELDDDWGEPADSDTPSPVEADSTVEPDDVPKKENTDEMA